jgi:hypothetical protein
MRVHFLASTLLIACSQEDGPAAPPESPGPGPGGACLGVDALPSGTVVPTDARDVRDLQVGCTSNGVDTLYRHDDRWTFQAASGPLEELSSVTASKVYAFGAAPGLIELDLGSSPAILASRLPGAPRVAVNAPPLRAVDPDSEWTFDDVCFDHERIAVLDGIPSSVALSLAPRAEGRGALLVQTCGYVDVVDVSPAGEPAKRVTILEVERSAPRVYLPLRAAFDLDGERVVAAALSIIGRAPQDVAVKVVAGGTLVREATFSFPDSTRSLASLRVCGPNAFLVGRREREIRTADPNDTTTSDVWVAKVDLSSMTLAAEATLDLDRDDVGFVVACDPTTDDVFVAGATARHHVDTGSWDGGGKAFVARLDRSLHVTARVAFGNDRMATARQLLVGKDNVLVAGTWDAIPNNHLPPAEDWSRGFYAVLPRALSEPSTAAFTSRP